jgi:hypothetical protein
VVYVFRGSRQLDGYDWLLTTQHLAEVCVNGASNAWDAGYRPAKRLVSLKIFFPGSLCIFLKPTQLKAS